MCLRFVACNATVERITLGAGVFEWRLVAAEMAINVILFLVQLPTIALTNDNFLCFLTFSVNKK